MSDPAVHLHALRQGSKAMARIIDRVIEECCAMPIGSPDRRDRISLIAELEGRRRAARAADPSAFASLLKVRGFASAASSTLSEPSRTEIERHDWEAAARRDRRHVEQAESDQVRRAAILKATARRLSVTVLSEP